MSSSSLVSEKSAQIATVIRSLNEIAQLSPKVGFDQLLFSQFGISPKLKYFEQDVTEDLPLLGSTQAKIQALLLKKKHYLHNLKTSLDLNFCNPENVSTKIDVNFFVKDITRGIQDSLNGVNQLLIHHVSSIRKFIKIMQNQLLALNDLQSCLQDYLQSRFPFTAFLKIDHYLF